MNKLEALTGPIELGEVVTIQEAPDNLSPLLKPSWKTSKKRGYEKIIEVNNREIQKIANLNICNLLASFTKSGMML